MASEHDEVERTEAPSPRWVAQVRDRGHWPRSGELVVACVVLAGLVMIQFASGPLVQSLLDTLRTRLASVEIAHFGIESALNLRHDILVPLLLTAPFLVILAVAAALANFVQVGFRFRPELLLPDATRLGATQRMEMVFSGRATRKSIFDLAKYSALLSLLVWWLWSDICQSNYLGNQAADQLLQHSTASALKVGTKLAAALLILGCLDYLLAWWSHQKQMRMSRMELTAELREMEGDPIIRRRRRLRQMDRAFARSENKLQVGSLVIVGKGRLTVAIRTVAGQPATILAKAVGTAADRLQRNARARGARIFRNDSLARAIYRGGHAGDKIPSEHRWAIVAEGLDCSPH